MHFTVYPSCLRSYKDNAVVPIRLQQSLYSDDLASFLEDFAIIHSSRPKEFQNFSAETKVIETKHDLAQQYSLKAVLLFTQASHTAWRKKTWQSGKGSCRHLRLTLKVMLPVAVPSLNMYLHLLWLCQLSISAAPLNYLTLGWLASCGQAQLYLDVCLSWLRNYALKPQSHKHF